MSVIWRNSNHDNFFYLAILIIEEMKCSSESGVYGFLKEFSCILDALYIY